MCRQLIDSLWQNFANKFPGNDPDYKRNRMVWQIKELMFFSPSSSFFYFLPYYSFSFIFGVGENNAIRLSIPLIFLFYFPLKNLRFSFYFLKWFYIFMLKIKSISFYYSSFCKFILQVITFWVSFSLMFSSFFLP